MPPTDDTTPRSRASRAVYGCGALVIVGSLLLLLLPSFAPRGGTTPTRKTTVVHTAEGDTFTLEQRRAGGTATSAVYAGDAGAGTALAAVQGAAAPLAPSIVCIYPEAPEHPLRVYEVDHTLLVWKWVPSGKFGGISYDALNGTADPHAYAFLLPVARRYRAHANPTWRISFAGFLAKHHDAEARALIERYATGDFTPDERAAAPRETLALARQYALQSLEHLPEP